MARIFGNLRKQLSVSEHHPFLSAKPVGIYELRTWRKSNHASVGEGNASGLACRYANLPVLQLAGIPDKYCQRARHWEKEQNGGEGQPFPHPPTLFMVNHPKAQMQLFEGFLQFFFRNPAAIENLFASSKEFRVVRMFCDIHLNPEPFLLIQFIPQILFYLFFTHLYISMIGSFSSSSVRVPDVCQPFSTIY